MYPVLQGYIGAAAIRTTPHTVATTLRGHIVIVIAVAFTTHRG